MKGEVEDQRDVPLGHLEAYDDVPFLRRRGARSKSSWVGEYVIYRLCWAPA